MRTRDTEKARLRVAMEIAAEVERAVDEGRPADRTLAARFRAHREYGSRDRRFYAEAVFALFRWRGWTGTLAEEGIRGLLRAVWLDGADPDPVFRAAAAELDLPFAALPGWGDLPLRDRAAAWSNAEGDRAEPGLMALIPDWVPDVLASESGSLPAWIEAFQSRPPLWLRAVGIDGATLCSRLQDNGIGARPHPVLRQAVVLDGHPHLGNLGKGIGPCFEVQDISAQAVIACAAPRPGERWWDACAGSGGKALALAEALGPDGHVLATDRRPGAVRELMRRIRASAAPGPKPVARVRDAIRLPAETAFDGVLLDAPCSGIGTWPRNPDARWRMNPSKLEACARIQARLLRSASRAVCSGGRLVYAVCTATRLETTDRIGAFLDETPEFKPDPVPGPLGGPPAHEHWIHPSAGPCSGMYMAVLRRRATPDE